MGEGGCRLGRDDRRLAIPIARLNKPLTVAVAVGLRKTTSRNRVANVAESAPQSGNKTGNRAATDWQHTWLAGLVLFAGALPQVVFEHRSGDRFQ